MENCGHKSTISVQFPTHGELHIHQEEVLCIQVVDDIATILLLQVMDDIATILLLQVMDDIATILYNSSWMI
jgi:hypothetical protein